MRTESVEVAAVHLQEGVSDGHPDARNLLVDPKAHDVERDPAGQRVPVRVESLGTDRDKRVAHLDERSVDQVGSVDDPHDESREVVLPLRVEVGHLGGFPAKERAQPLREQPRATPSTTPWTMASSSTPVAR